MDQFTIIRGTRAVAPAEIHPAWCDCSDCKISLRRSIVADVKLMALAAVSTLAMAGVLYVVGFIR